MSQFQQLLEHLNGAATILAKESPVVAHQIIVNGIASDILAVSVSTALLAVSLIASWLAYRAHKSDEWGDEALLSGLLMVTAIFGVIFVVVCAFAGWDIFQALHFPQLYILNTLTS